LFIFSSLNSLETGNAPEKPTAPEKIRKQEEVKSTNSRFQINIQRLRRNKGKQKRGEIWLNAQIVK
jgi:hypothetical protein